MAERNMTDHIRARLYRATELALEDDPDDEQLRDIVSLVTSALVRIGKTPRGAEHVKAEQERRAAATETP